MTTKVGGSFATKVYPCCSEHISKSYSKMSVREGKESRRASGMKTKQKVDLLLVTDCAFLQN